MRLLLQLACLHYLPLGDALTLIFTEPLWTVAASKLVLGTRIGPWKFCFALVLLTGMFLCIQPPFLFGARPEEGGQNDVVNGTNSISNSTSNNQGSGSNNQNIDPDKKEHTQFENLYFVGVSHSALLSKFISIQYYLKSNPKSNSIHFNPLPYKSTPIAIHSHLNQLPSQSNPGWIGIGLSCDWRSIECSHCKVSSG